MQCEGWTLRETTTQLNKIRKNQQKLFNNTLSKKKLSNIVHLISGFCVTISYFF
jgi:hypothetical protein